MIIALHVETVHTTGAKRVGRRIDGESAIQVEMVVLDIGPGGLSDKLKRTPLESPVYGPEAERPFAGRIIAAVIPRTADFNAEKRAEGHAADHCLAVIVVETIIGRRGDPLSCVPEPAGRADHRSPSSVIPLKSLCHVQFIVEL